MAWSLAPRLFRPRAAEAPLLHAESVSGFPAGVIALGRGGAGEIGALLRDDGVYAGLLRVLAPPGRSLTDVAAFAEALPTGACQIVTVRWPIDPDRAARSWRAATRGGTTTALAGEIGAGYLPALAEAGWSEVRTFLAILRPDPERLLRDLVAVAGALPLPARPVTLAEAKHLAGEWFAPHAAGLVTIGWSLTELIAEPRPDWARTVLEAPVLRGIATTLTLHLEPVGTPAPVSLELHRRLAEIDAEIAARRNGGPPSPDESDEAEDLLAERHELLAALAASGTSNDRPRPAQLLLGCSVEQQSARAIRGEIEAVLHRVGLQATSLGPGRSDDTLLSCSPLGIALVGRELTLTTRGASLLAPIVPAMDGLGAMGSDERPRGLPLGLRRDGAAATVPPGSDLVAVGEVVSAPTSAIQTWALGQLASGTEVLVVDTHGGWRSATLAAGGARVSVAPSLGGLLGGLGAEILRDEGPTARQITRWADMIAKILVDLCPDLDDDELGDLTGQLLALAEGDLAWGEPVQLGPIIERLRASEKEPAHDLAALLTATGASKPAPPHEWQGGLTVFEAVPDNAGQRLASPAGCAAVALGAIRDALGNVEADGRVARLIVLDDLATLLEASAGPTLLSAILTAAGRAGVPVWCAASSLAACPRPALEALRALSPLAVLFPAPPDSLRATARALDLPPGLFDGRAGLNAGEALVIHGEEATPIQLLPLALPPFTLR